MIEKLIITEEMRSAGKKLREENRAKKLAEKVHKEKEAKDEALIRGLAECRIASDQKTAQFQHFCLKGSSSNVTVVGIIDIDFRPLSSSERLFAKINANIKCERCGGTGEIWNSGGAWHGTNK